MNQSAGNRWLKNVRVRLIFRWKERNIKWLYAALTADDRAFHVPGTSYAGECGRNSPAMHNGLWRFSFVDEIFFFRRCPCSASAAQTVTWTNLPFVLYRRKLGKQDIINFVCCGVSSTSTQNSGVTVTHFREQQMGYGDADGWVSKRRYSEPIIAILGRVVNQESIQDSYFRRVGYQQGALHCSFPSSIFPSTVVPFPTLSFPSIFFPAVEGRNHVLKDGGPVPEPTLYKSCQHYINFA